MESKPTNEAIAKASGLDERVVGGYRCGEERRPDGRWLIFFGREIIKIDGAQALLSDDLTFLMPEQ